MKYKYLSLLFVYFIILNINYSQITLSPITKYKSERKSLKYVTSGDNYFVVENDKNTLDLLTPDKNGQLFKYYESNTPFCDQNDKKIIDVNENYVLNYDGEIAIIENIHTGEVKTYNNLPKTGERRDRSCFLAGSKHFQLRSDSNYLYRISDGKLISSYKNNFYIKGDLIRYYEIINNKYKYKIKNTSDSVITSINEGAYFIDKTKFDGIVFQDQKSDSFENFSKNYRLYFVHQNFRIDTLSGTLPKISTYTIDTRDSNLILLSENIMDNQWNLAKVVYKYYEHNDSLAAIDTIKYDINYASSFLTDSLFYISNYTGHIIRNFYTKKEINITSNKDRSLFHHIGNKLVFMGRDSSILCYDYKLDKLVVLTEATILSYRNVNWLKTDSILHLIDLEQLTLPSFHITDSISIVNQDISLTANKNGLRKSNLSKTENYIFTIDDDSIIVVDTTQSNGVRKIKVINEIVNLGLSNHSMHSYKDIIFLVINVKEGNSIVHHLISVDLKTEIVTNLTKKYNFEYLNNRDSYINGYSNIIQWSDYLYDAKNETFKNVKDIIKNQSINKINIINNKVILSTFSDIFTFTYPDLNFESSIKYQYINAYDEKYYYYKKPSVKDKLFFSNGTSEIAIESLENYNLVNYFAKDDLNVVVVYSSDKKNVKCYSISNNTSNTLEIFKEIDYNFNSISTLQLLIIEKNVLISNLENNTWKTLVYNLETKTLKVINDINFTRTIDLYNNHIFYIDNENKKICKLTLDGVKVKTIDFPENIYFINPNPEVDNGHNGVYMLSGYTYRNYPNLIFDSEVFDFQLNTGCTNHVFTSLNHNNFVYKNDRYYLNLDDNQTGKQVYVFKNPYVEQTNSLTETSTKSLEIYPNPSSSSIRIVNHDPCQIKSINIYNTMGNRVIINTYPCQEFIDIDHLQSGIYTLEVQTESYRKSTLFVRL